MLLGPPAVGDVGFFRPALWWWWKRGDVNQGRRDDPAVGGMRREGSENW